MINEKEYDMVVQIKSDWRHGNDGGFIKCNAMRKGQKFFIDGWPDKYGSNNPEDNDILEVETVRLEEDGAVTLVTTDHYEFSFNTHYFYFLNQDRSDNPTEFDTIELQFQAGRYLAMIWEARQMLKRADELISFGMMDGMFCDFIEKFLDNTEDLQTTVPPIPEEFRRPLE